MYYYLLDYLNSIKLRVFKGRSILRTVAIGLNSILFIFLLSVVFVDGWPNKPLAVFAIISFLFVLAFNVLFLLKSNEGNESWLSLFFQRKRLEEKRKIQKLNDE